MLHIFKYKIKSMLVEKTSLFWTFLFPIILSLLYYSVFPGITDTKLEPFPIAVVAADDTLVTSMEDSGLFEITKTNAENAQEMFDNGDVKGIVSEGNPYRLTVMNTGLEESIVKFFMDSYISINVCISDAVSQNTLSYEQLADIDLSKTYTQKANVNDNLDKTVIYFYALIGMTAIMGGTLAVGDVANYQANQSAYAARIVTAPIKKSSAFFVSITATVLFHFATLLLTLLFLQFVLGIDFGTRIPEIILLCFVACFTGMMLGAFVSSLIKKREGTKIAIILSYTLAGCFLSGMMEVNIKFLVAEHMPFIQYINPTSLVTDALYALYYYPGHERYLMNLGILLVFGIVATIGTGLVLRRQQYASI